MNLALEELIAQLQALTDISEEEACNLNGLLSLLFKCSSFFAHQQMHTGDKREEQQHADDENEQQQQEEEEEHVAATKGHVKSWTKYVKIVNMLDSKMVVIVDSFVKGLMPEFSADELKRLIVALFSDSPLRKAQLALIK